MTYSNMYCQIQCRIFTVIYPVDTCVNTLFDLYVFYRSYSCYQSCLCERIYSIVDIFDILFLFTQIIWLDSYMNDNNKQLLQSINTQNHRCSIKPFCKVIGNIHIQRCYCMPIYLHWQTFLSNIVTLKQPYSEIRSECRHEVP